ncbi:Inositol phosphatase SIW14 [Elasticomyces elasticus]
MLAHKLSTLLSLTFLKATIVFKERTHHSQPIWLEVLQDGKRGQVTTSNPLTGDLAPLSVMMVEKLNQLPTVKLGEILWRGTADEKEWDGYSGPELNAAKVLI